jgi:hypothetical protein
VRDENAGDRRRQQFGDHLVPAHAEMHPVEEDALARKSAVRQQRLGLKSPTIDIGL